MHPVVPTTFTQFTFAIGLLLVTPVLALVAMSVQRARNEGMFSGAYLVGFASCLGWFGGGASLAWLYPDYPHGGHLSEPVAMLFLLPGIFNGVATLWWLSRRPVVRKPTRVTWSVLGASVALAALLATWGVLAKIERELGPARRALPEDAQVIEEHLEEDGFLPDYNYSLSARMPESSFHEWMRRLAVEPDDSAHGDTEPADATQGWSEHGYYENGVGHFEARYCW